MKLGMFIIYLFLITFFRAAHTLPHFGLPKYRPNLQSSVSILWSLPIQISTLNVVTRSVLSRTLTPINCLPSSSFPYH